MNNNVFNGNNGIARLCLSAVMLIGLSACGGGSDSSDSEDREGAYVPPPDVSVEDTPLDDVPEHQELELQEYMFETAEFRSPHR